MKKLCIITIIASLFIGSVNAQELYYENNEGVSFTKQEYDKISEFYWEGYQDYLSIEDNVSIWFRKNSNQSRCN